jgi:hypothetical protein
MSNLTADRLRELLEYDPETGIFTWRVRRAGKTVSGSPAGCVGPKGYVRIDVDCVTYRAHRLAWLYVHGEWPSGMLDHRNRIRHDNRISNLRLANLSLNAANSTLISTNKSGFRGVSWHNRDKRWVSQICVNGRVTFLGNFKDPVDAARAYDKAAAEAFGEFAGINFPLDGGACEP